MRSSDFGSAGYLRRFSDQPVAEIVQCGEPGKSDCAAPP